MFVCVCVCVVVNEQGVRYWTQSAINKVQYEQLWADDDENDVGANAGGGGGIASF